MPNQLERVHALLSSDEMGEATVGASRGKTPILASMKTATRIAGVAALAALGACAGPGQPLSMGQMGRAAVDSNSTTTAATLLGAGLGGWAGNNMGGRHDKVASTIAGVAVGGLLGHMIGDAAAPHEAPYGAAQIGSAPRAYGSPYGTAPAYENGGGLHHADGGRNRTAPAYENGGFTPDPAPSYGNGYAPGGYYGNADGYAQGAGYRQPSFGQQQDLQRRLAFAPLGTQVRYEASNGDVGIYTPIREGRTRDGRFCREYQGAVTKADGEQINGFGSACRNPNGSWQVISAADTRRDSDFAEVHLEIDLEAAPAARMG